MSTLTLELDSTLAHVLKESESACREHKHFAAWARERLPIAAMETKAESSGYTPSWLMLFGSIDDDTFTAPVPTATKPASAVGWCPDALL